VATRPPPVQVKNLATAYWQSEVAYSLTHGGIIDAVGEAPPGGIKCGDVANKLDLKPDNTCRMMRAGEGVKLLAMAPGDGAKYILAGAGELLTTKHPGSLRDFMLMINEETKFAWRAAGTSSLKSGSSGFLSHFGKEFWEWHSEPRNKRQMAQFDGAMKSFSAEMSGSLLVDWAPPNVSGTVCDIGGGAGHMLVAMAKHYPHLHGFLFDLPPVAKRATAGFASENLDSRLTALGGSFFDPLPKELAICDAFYLKFILHDWSDSQNAKIFGRIKDVAKPGAKIVTTDFILGLDGQNMEMSKRLMDINMMASNPSGARERTHDEYTSLFPKAGLSGQIKLIKMRDLVSTLEVIV